MLLFYFFEIIDPSIEYKYAIKPLDFNHLIGTVSAVFIHGSIEHLSSNFLPLSICLFGLFYFYNNIALSILSLSHLLTGLCIWLFARPVFHVGASGLVYALIFFVMISAILKSNKQLIIFAFVILVFQGGLFWGMVPQNNQISWESHLIGALVGSLLAYLFKNKGPKSNLHHYAKSKYSIEDDEYLHL
jgi:membrane associated rhomboid family serine protease